MKMERERFVEIFNRYNLTDVLDELFEKKDSYLIETANFIIHYNTTWEEAALISQDFDNDPKIINWYKLYHVGRALNLYGFENEEQVDEFLCKLREDIKEMYMI